MVAPQNGIDTLMNDLMQLDQLKAVKRASYIASENRKENSAEHSWHIAMSAWMLSKYLDLKVDKEKLLKLALTHDICEIGAGDIFAYSAERASAGESEAIFMTSYKNSLSHYDQEIYLLWAEYEEQRTIESKVVRLCDHLLPFLLNFETQGKLWRENNISKARVIERNIAIMSQFPEIWRWVQNKIDECVRKGYLTM